MYISIPVSSTSGWVYFSLCMLFDALAISSSNTKKDTVYSLNYKGIQQKAGGGCCTVCFHSSSSKGALSHNHWPASTLDIWL